MKNTAVMIAAIAVAQAAAPDKSFKLPTLQVGYAKSCQGADTLTVSSTPKAVTWRFSDFGSTYPESAPPGPPWHSALWRTNSAIPLQAGASPWTPLTQVGDYTVHNTTLNSDGKDLDGDFSVKVPSKSVIFSPCWPENGANQSDTFVTSQNMAMVLEEKGDVDAAWGDAQNTGEAAWKRPRHS
ncbi:hypothetical protein CHU98_g5417 [Xylaria longipes]|nr:hypothetical protein CHU98_g5417 [Xylaria longipes]